MLLGDIGMEQESFDGALSDYSESIKLLSPAKVQTSPVGKSGSAAALFPPGRSWPSLDSIQISYGDALRQLDDVHGVQGIERKMAELHYKTALALQFLDEPETALQHTNVRSTLAQPVLLSPERVCIFLHFSFARIAS